MSIRLRSDGHSVPEALSEQLRAGRPCRIELLTALTTLVPSELFPADDPGAFLSAAGLTHAAGPVVTSDPAQPVVAVMAIAPDLLASLEAAGSGPLHFTSPLLHEPPHTGPCVWMDFAEDLLYIKVYDRELQLAEVFAAQDETTTLYLLARLDRFYGFRKRFSALLAAPVDNGLRRSIKPFFRHLACE